MQFVLLLDLLMKKTFVDKRKNLMTFVAGLQFY